MAQKKLRILLAETEPSETADTLRALGALVALGLLVYVERRNVHLGPVPFALVGIAHQKPVTHVLRMRKVTPDGRDDRQLLAA